MLHDNGLTEYRLARKCGLSQSTITNIFKRNTVPSIAILEAICKGFVNIPSFRSQVSGV